MTPLRLVVLVFFGASATAMEFAAQAPPQVDFRRDVQPIFREHCYACHGPDQQMNGLRLDRRADAMRGGTQSVIGPGNADGSRLYHRLIGKSVGPQMPPTGPLGAKQVAVLKAWIDQGAEWPDDLAGVAPPPAVDPDAERLTGLLRDGDRAGVEEMLRKNPRAARARATGASTPLMFAALYGDVGLMKRLIDAGAEPGASNIAGATALMWAVPDTDKMRLLLGSGVNVDARSDDRRTALVIAAGIVGSAPAVTLLLEHGASPSPLSASDPSPLREAARVNNADVFRLLLDYGADRSAVLAAFLRSNCFRCAEALGVGGAGPLALVPPLDRGLRPALLPSASQTRAVGVTSATRTAIHAAVERSLPLLQKVDRPFIQKTGCVSCHHNSLVASAVAVARRNGYRVDEQAASDQRTIIATYLESWRERTLQNMFIAGQQDTISYLLFGLAAAQHPSNRATDAQALGLLRRQSPDGHWPLATLRPPIESNDIEVTAMSMRALQLYAPKTRRADYLNAVVRARNWLASAKAETTEERAFRALGLSWAEAGQDLVTGGARELLAGQRSDGGWSQLPSMESDAYATGEALVALRESGAVPEGNPAVRRGAEYLLRTQLEDGSWFVKSRAVPIQAYFESGFPHGADQWISAAATAWAVTALALEK
jgi:hypothetical protein